MHLVRDMEGNGIRRLAGEIASKSVLQPRNPVTLSNRFGDFGEESAGPIENGEEPVRVERILGENIPAPDPSGGRGGKTLDEFRRRVKIEGRIVHAVRTEVLLPGDDPVRPKKDRRHRTFVPQTVPFGLESLPPLRGRRPFNLQAEGPAYCRAR